MNLLIKSAVLIFPQHKLHGKSVDIFIKNGVVESISSKSKSKADKEFDAKGMFVSSGWIDLNANFCDPGFEWREDTESGLLSAAYGGYTQVCTMPTTMPSIQTKGDVKYQLKKAEGNIVSLLPIGSVSIDNKGEELSELFDMHQNGAVAFSDGYKDKLSSQIMLRSLLYTKNFNGLTFSFPEDEQLSEGGQINEGKMSAELGMKTIPTIAELIRLERDIALLEYSDSRLHVCSISSKDGVEAIRKAKKKGLKITCDVSIHNLVATEDKLADFDTNYKVKPPLRATVDVKALIKGLNDGTIDAITSRHTPWEEELKTVEFQLAPFGMTSIQTVYSHLIEAGIEREVIVEKLSTGPQKVLGITSGLVEGENASLTLFNDEEWTLDKNTNKSKSKNTPYFNVKLKGKAQAIFNNNQFKILK